MSATTSITCIKLNISPSCSSSSSSSSCSSATSFRCFSNPSIIRCSNAEGPLRRPSSPPLRQPSLPTTTIKPVPPSSPPPSTPSKQSSESSSSSTVTTVEFQRKVAKELQEYFRQKKLEESNQGPFFGFLGKNEIANGRWAMFGFAVGLLTEYATGSDFVDQLKILLSNFGIIDLD